MTTATAKRPGTKAPKATMRFRLLHGLHTEGRQRDSVNLENLKQQLEEGMITQDEFNKQSKGLKPRRVYHAGEMIESRMDLTRLNGPYPMTPKFAKADTDVAAMDPVPYPMAETRPVPIDVEDTLSSMSMEQLRKMARSEDISITGLTTTEEIAHRIRTAMAEMEG